MLLVCGWCWNMTASLLFHSLCIVRLSASRCQSPTSSSRGTQAFAKRSCARSTTRGHCRLRFRFRHVTCACWIAFVLLYGFVFDSYHRVYRSCFVPARTAAPIQNISNRNNSNPTKPSLLKLMQREGSF